MIGPLAYIGGKRRLAPTIIKLFPPHTTYVEPFAGGAQVFFHKAPSRVEVLNDTDEEIVNFFRVCQRHPQELARILRWQPRSRRLFQWQQSGPAPDATDVERAARFFYLQRNAWSGKRLKRNFRYSVTAKPQHHPHRLPERLLQVAARLQHVLLEALPYEDILKRYDRSTTLFYCDPPYIGAKLYASNFSDEQFDELASRLATLKGRFLLSINDCPQARKWFGRFHCQAVECTYTSARVPKRFSELLFANYPLPSPSAP